MALSNVITDPDLLGLVKKHLHNEYFKTLRLVSKNVHAACNKTITVARRGRKVYGDGGARKNALSKFLKFASTCPNLSVLDLAGRPLDLSSIRTLRRYAGSWPNLLVINLDGTLVPEYRFQDKGQQVMNGACEVAHASWPRLQTLTMTDCGVIRLPALRQMTSLTKLHLGGRGTDLLPGRFLQDFPHLPNLVDLMLDCVFFPVGVSRSVVTKFVSSLDDLFPRIERLSFHGCCQLFKQNPLRVMTALAGLKLPALREMLLPETLTLDAHDAIGETLAAAPWLSTVRHLDLSRGCTSVRDSGWVYVIDTAGTGLRSFLRKANAPCLEILNLSGSLHYSQSESDNFHDALRSFVNRAPHIVKLNLDYCKGVVTVNMPVMRRMHLPRLKELSLSAVQHIATNQHFLESLHCPQLTFLNVSRCPQLYSLDRLVLFAPSLRRLDISGTSLCLMSLRKLAEFYCLDDVVLGQLKDVRASDMLFAAHYVRTVLPGCRVHT